MYFSSEWCSLLEVSFRNFLASVMHCLPLPAVLRFNTDRRLRQALQQQVRASAVSTTACHLMNGRMRVWSIMVCGGGLCIAPHSRGCIRGTSAVALGTQ